MNVMGNAAYKKRHLEQGLCRECSRPAVPGLTRCAIHLINNNKGVIRWNAEHREHKRKLRRDEIKRRKEEGCCPKCGAPLHEEDEGYMECLNCRIQIGKPRWCSPISEVALENYYKKVASQP